MTRERERERLRSFQQCVSDRTHSLTGCIDGESDGGGGGQDGKHTVAGRPTNQNRDEGMWAWPEERQCRAGEFYSPPLTVVGATIMPAPQGRKYCKYM